jgi:hypothetical protein
MLKLREKKVLVGQIKKKGRGEPIKRKGVLNVMRNQNVQKKVHLVQNFLVR